MWSVQAILVSISDLFNILLDPHDPDDLGGKRAPRRINACGRIAREINQLHNQVCVQAGCKKVQIARFSTVMNLNMCNINQLK